MIQFPNGLQGPILSANPPIGLSNRNRSGAALGVAKHGKFIPQQAKLPLPPIQLLGARTFVRSGSGATAAMREAANRARRSSTVSTFEGNTPTARAGFQGIVGASPFGIPTLIPVHALPPNFKVGVLLPQDAPLLPDPTQPDRPLLADPPLHPSQAERPLLADPPSHGFQKDEIEFQNLFFQVSSFFGNLFFWVHHSVIH